MRTPLLAGLLALLLPACLMGEISDVGGDDPGMGSGSGDGDGDGDGSDNVPTPRVTASIDNSAVSTELGKTETLALTITGADGFSGPVSITPSLMEGATAVTDWTVTATPATVDLTENGTATVMLELKIPTDTAALAPTLTLDVSSTAAPTNVTSTFTVANQYTINIPAGAGTGSLHPGLPGVNEPLRLRMGAKVVFHNADTVAHRIHANGGIDHQDNDLTPGNDYIATPTDSATWYCHSHETPLNRPILVQ